MRFSRIRNSRKLVNSQYIPPCISYLAVSTRSLIRSVGRLVGRFLIVRFIRFGLTRFVSFVCSFVRFILSLSDCVVRLGSGCFWLNCGALALALAALRRNRLTLDVYTHYFTGSEFQLLYAIQKPKNILFCTCRDRCVVSSFSLLSLSPCVMYKRYIYLFIYFFYLLWLSVCISFSFLN